MLNKAVRAVGAAVVIGGLAASPLQAEDSAIITYKAMSLSVAQELAQATLEDCRKRGYQVAVAVTDRFGNIQVMLRDRFAGAHTPETARRKAWTAVSFRTHTLDMDGLIKDGELTPAIRHVSQALMIGGGMMVEAQGGIVGGVGVSGAPGGQADHDCAVAGIDAVVDKLEF